MSTVATFNLNPTLTTFGTPEVQGVALPWGGPLGGGPYQPYTALGNVPGTPQPEIWTLTVGGSGSFIFQVIANSIKSSATIASGATAAQVCAALQQTTNAAGNTTGIFPTWMLPNGSVTNPSGGTYVITFAKNVRLGMGTQFVTVSGTPNPSLVRTQRGNVGAGQYDVWDGVTVTNVNAVLFTNAAEGVTGSLDTTPYGPPDDSTWNLSAIIEGYITANLIPNVSNAMVTNTVPGLSFYRGNNVAQAGCVLKLTQ